MDVLDVVLIVFIMFVVDVMLIVFIVLIVLIVFLTFVSVVALRMRARWCRVRVGWRCHPYADTFSIELRRGVRADNRGAQVASWTGSLEQTDDWQCIPLWTHDTRPDFVRGGALEPGDERPNRLLMLDLSLNIWVSRVQSVAADPYHVTVRYSLGARRARESPFGKK